MLFLMFQRLKQSWTVKQNDPRGNAKAFKEDRIYDNINRAIKKTADTYRGGHTRPQIPRGEVMGLHSDPATYEQIDNMQEGCRAYRQHDQNV